MATIMPTTGSDVTAATRSIENIVATQTAKKMRK
jgi:hypothetical protein